jgi:hypothetical protein
MGRNKEMCSLAEALFASPLQPSDHPAEAQIREAIVTSLRQHHGTAGCAAVMAAEFGKYPDVAAARMQWALSVLAAA